MFSRMYIFNSVFPVLIIDNFHPVLEDNKGYHPTDKKMTSELKPADSNGGFEYDSLKLYYLEKLIIDCQGKTNLIFTASPIYENTSDSVLTPIKTLCDKYGITFLNHYTDSTFNFRRDYFYDRGHLNRTGATAYTKVIASEIKRIRGCSIN